MKLEKVNVAVANPYDVIIDNDLIKNAGHHLEDLVPVSYTHLTLPTTPYV